MSERAPEVKQLDENLSRLLREKLAGDERSVQAVMAYIRRLRAGPPAPAWEAEPPERCDRGPVPHS